MKVYFALLLIIVAAFFCSCTQSAIEIHIANVVSTPTLQFNESVTKTSTPTIIPSSTPTPTLFERKAVMTSPKIVIMKSERMLYVYDDDTLCAKIKIAIGSSTIGHKQKEGDGKTPEGEYYICTRNDKSKYYLALGVSYPNIEDAKVGLENGLINQDEYNRIEDAILSCKRPPWDTALGGEIAIHGCEVDSDWTAGCIAAHNFDIDYLWENCPIGTPITILP
jgi:murein L,D-transpeptidase YafK